jgi:HPt (histidine-containing phosphotransfer) domain-containing protein
MATEPIDLEALHRLRDDLGGNLDMVRDLIQTYLHEAPLTIARIRSGVAGGDASAVAQAAHSFKSGCSMVGATRLRTLALQLEETALQGSLAGAEQRVNEMAHQLPAVATYLKAWPRA